MNALTAVVLLVFSLVLIAIGLVATARVRRSGRARPQGSAPAPAPAGPARARSAQLPDYDQAPMGGAPAYPADEGAGQPETAYPGERAVEYPGGMDAETAEIERLKAEIAALKAHNGDGSGFKRTQAMVAVAANVSGILGLVVSIAALMK